MLKPSEIQSKDLKKGFGYNRKQVDDFLDEIFESYHKLYNENIEYKDKLAILNEGLQYYKSIEKTLQKALVLAQKTADDNHAEALKRAKTIEIEARVKAEQIVQSAKKEFKDLKNKASELIIKYDTFRSQFKALAASQIEVLENENFNVHLNDLNKTLLDISYSENEESEKLTSSDFEPIEVEEEKIEEVPFVREKEKASEEDYEEPKLDEL